MTGLKLYEAYAGEKGQPVADPGTVIDVNSAYCEFGDRGFDAGSADLDPQKEFQAFLTEKELGTFDAETGTWWYQPPQARVAQGEVVNLAYGLEEMDTGAFFSYFGLDVFRQSEILSNALNQS